MTKAAKHFGKHLTHFWTLSETREYMCIIVNDLYSNSRDHDDLNADARAALHWYSVGSIRLMTHKEEAAIRAAVAPLEQRIAGLLHLLAAPPSAMSVKHCLQRSRATPLQRICPAVHQKPAKATTAP